MKNKKGFLLLAVIVIGIIFFSYAPVLTYDSSHYLYLTNMIAPNNDATNWDIGRGPSFPLLIYISNIIFGHDADGILMLMFIFYLVMLIFTYLLLKKVNKKLNIFNTSKEKSILIILVGIFIAFNPIIFGYYHTLLTEFVGTTVAIIACYCAWNWFEVSFEENHKKYILYTIFFAILTVFSWHIKQPFVGCAIFPLIIAALLSIIKKFSWKNILQRMCTIIICVIFLIISIFVWNKVLIYANAQEQESRTTSSFINDGITRGVSELQQTMTKENANDEIIENVQISLKEKEEIKKVINGKSKYNNFVLFENKNENWSDIVIFTKGEIMSTGDAIKFVLKTGVKSPLTLIKSYIKDYLATANFYYVVFPNVVPEITDNINILGACENDLIGYRVYDENLPKTFSTLEKYQQYVEPYKTDVEPIRIVNVAIKSLKTFSTITFKISFAFLPIVLIGVIIINIRKRNAFENNTKEILNVVIILLSFSFIHTVFHAVLGSTIDRYIVPAMIPMFIAYIIIGYLLKEKCKKY